MRAWCSGELELERAGAKSKRKKEESRRRARVRRARHEASSGIERQSCASAQHKGAAGNRAELRPSVRGGGQGAEGGRAARGAGWRLAYAETGADQAACGGGGGGKANGTLPAGQTGRASARVSLEACFPSPPPLYSSPALQPCSGLLSAPLLARPSAPSSRPSPALSFSAPSSVSLSPPAGPVQPASCKPALGCLSPSTAIADRMTTRIHSQALHSLSRVGLV